MEKYYETYKQRQAIVEHPFGIIKRQWGFDYIMTKQTKKRASADVGLIYIAFNLRRIFNILDKNELKKYLGVLDFYFRTSKSDLEVFYGLVFFKRGIMKSEKRGLKE